MAVEMIVWLDAVGYEGLYQVSDAGNVRSVNHVNRLGRRITGRVLKTSNSSSGYPMVALHKDGRQTTKPVHLIVATAFHGARPDGLVCCHADDNKMNMTAANLRWGTTASNGIDKVLNGKSAVGSRNGNAKLNETLVVEIKAKLALGAIRNHLRKEYGVSFQTIERISTGQNWCGV